MAQTEPIQWSPQPLSSPLGKSELKAVVCNVAIPTSPEWTEERYSSYTKLLNINAWILRFVGNLKLKLCNKPMKLSSSLSALEIRSSEFHLFSRSQDCHFMDEHLHLSQSKLLKHSSTILSLNPSLGEGDLLMVGGHLSNSSLKSFTKAPPPHPPHTCKQGCPYKPYALLFTCFPLPLWPLLTH